MFENYFSCEIYDHILEFRRVFLEAAYYSPEDGLRIPVPHGEDYFVSGETGEHIQIDVRYRGLKGTPSYQLGVYVDDRLVREFMVQDTPHGEIYTEKNVRW